METKMIEDISKTIKSQLYERISSPLLSSFVISWILWNYKFALILISDESISQKFELISAYVDSWRYGWLLPGFSLPATTTLIYIFIYPLPARYAYSYWREQQRKLKLIRQKIEDETPLTLEESRHIKRETNRLTLEYEESIRQKDSEIERLRSLLSEHQDSNNDEKNNTTQQASFKNEDINLSNGQIDILEFIGNSSDGIRRSAMKVMFGGDEVAFSFNIEQLIDYGLISRSRLSNGDYKYKITGAGLRSVMKVRKQAKASGSINGSAIN